MTKNLIQNISVYTSECVFVTVILAVIAVCTATGAWNWLWDPDTLQVRGWNWLWDPDTLQVRG